MNLSIRVALAALAALSFAAQAQAPAPAPRLPVDVFASRPLISDLDLSADGTRIAGLLNQGDDTLLFTRAIAGGALKVILKSDNKEFMFNWARWVGNDRILASVRFASRRYFTGTVETRLLSMKPDGSDIVNLVRNPARQGSMATGPASTQQLQDRVIDWLPGDGQHVLLALSEPGHHLPAVYKVDVRTAERKLVKSPERDVHEWITDAQHRVRIAVYDDGTHQEVRACDIDGKNWRTLWRAELGRDEVIEPIGFGSDPQELFVRADHDGREAIWSVRLDDPSLKKRLRLADKHRDIGSALLHLPATGAVLGLRTHREDRHRSSDADANLWNPAWREIARAIDKQQPNAYNRIVEMSEDGQRFIVLSSSRDRPDRYFLGNGANGQLAWLGDTYPDLADATLATKRTLQVKARDGLMLDSFLTLPVGRQLDDKGPTLPMVLLPHGGPSSHDDETFDPWPEFLANRGYAVLQVNFRGSSGQGSAFEFAGLRRWGLEMQDDLTDAVQWAIEHKVTDSGRICIVGASYGGYAALMGAVKTPDLYRCAASFAGVTDLQDLIAFRNEYVGGSEGAERQIGKYWGDRERLRATSPALQAERIRVPVLLVHGTSDRRVPVEQSADMAKALRKAGKSVRYIEQEGGDHHLTRSSYHVQWLTELEKFLDQNIGGPSSAP
jgi:dipeptidyl aminopeptidase/acylaminoacyl peptidase